MTTGRSRPDRALLPARQRIDAASRPRAGALACAANERAPPARRLAACRHLLVTGALDEAEAALRALAAVPEAAAEADALRRTCALLRQQAPALTDPIDEHEQGCFWRARAPGASTTIVAFAGRAQRIGVSAYFMRRILSRLGCNLVLLFDPAERFFLGGVAGLGASVEETAAVLRPAVAALGGRRLICLGQSSGGFGAIRYARALHADAVLAFSPTLPRPATRARLLQTVAGCGPDAFDLLAHWRTDPAPPRLRIVCGAEHRADLALARSWQGEATVEVVPLPGLSGHCSLQHMVMDGSFAPMARDFIATTAIPAA